jgi:cyclic pyranopterin phosphate synthase
VTTLIDPHDRRIRYLRISLTDRCNFRCVYCMAPEMRFMPRSDLLRHDEIINVVRVFIQLGVRQIRLTGGEPLIRPGVIDLVQQIKALDGLEELMLTTNGALLPQLAKPLRAAGLDRLNISLDTLRPDRFRELTRTGMLDDVLAGIAAAKDAGFHRIRLNCVLLKGRNDDEIIDLVAFARHHELDIAFIEEMPLGDIEEHDRSLCLVPSAQVLQTIRERYPTLEPVTDRTSGPARYHRMHDSSIRVGVISPHSHNFCGDCNRLRLTSNGRLLMCLGHEHGIDLKDVLRQHPPTSDIAQVALRNAITSGIQLKPAAHSFDLSAPPKVVRFMSMTGG